METRQSGEGAAGDRVELVSYRNSQPLEIAAYQRSPTLMAGEAGGTQGQVRVWAPNRRVLRKAAITVAIGAALMMALACVSIDPIVPGTYCFVLVCCLGGLLAALRRPAYVTTDGSGIAITTRRGSRAFRWSDIQEAKWFVDGGAFAWSRIRLHTTESVEIVLAGYSRKLQRELLNLIISSSGLYEHPVFPKRFVRSDGFRAGLPAPLASSKPGQAKRD